MWDFNALKTRVGVTDTSKDGELKICMQATVDAVEKYLNRKIGHAVYTEEFFDTHSSTLSLQAYPVDKIVKIHSTANHYHVNKESGIVQFHNVRFVHDFVITYEGGYKALPGQLEIAMVSLFDQYWASLTTAGAVASASGAVQSITSDGATIRFDTSGGSATPAGIDPTTGFPSAVKSMLDLYRRELA